MNKTAKYKHSGFTLLESMVATMLIAIAITAILAANAAYSRSNGAGVTLSTAEFLIDQIRAITDTLPAIDPESDTDTFGAEEASLALYDDVDDFDGLSLSPPVDLSGSELTDLAHFTQQITVENVLSTNLETTASDHSTTFLRVTATVLVNGRDITSSSWIRTYR
jgi:prepilin-type N-terminal cleavage/methylation domain-containing protein